MLFRSVIVLSIVALCFAVGESKPREYVIPLDQIWALGIPGTKDILKLENREKFRGMKAAERIKNSLVENTKYRLSSDFRPPRNQSAGPGFVVAGTGLDALKEANAILTDKKGRSETLPSNKELTLVFYSYMCARYVRLDEVRRSGRHINIKYHFESHVQAMSSTHFALIPIGKFTPGVVDVHIERLPDTNTLTPLDDERVRQLVCESFSIQVE